MFKTQRASGPAGQEQETRNHFPTEWSVTTMGVDQNREQGRVPKLGLRRPPDDLFTKLEEAITYCDKKVHGDSYPNRSIQWVARGDTASPWYGPIIVTKKLGLETDLAAYTDMDLRDYRDVIDTLVYDYIPGVSTVSTDGSSIQSLYSARTVQGVRVSCSGDIDVLGADKFIPVAVLTFDPVFVADKSTSSEMVGVPVRVRKFPPHPAWKDSGVTDIYENQEATRLFRDMDPEHEGFGLAARYWDLGVGSVLVVRDDGKDITPQQVEALCYYSWEHSTDMFQDAFEYHELT